MAKLVIGTDKTVGVPAVVKEVEKQEKYPLLSRVKDDSNHDVGIVVGYHTDANSQKYAVVALDAKYRATGQNYCSDQTTVIPGLPLYKTTDVYEAPETATFNCDKILDFCIAGGYTTGATYCRSQSFVIDGVTYYGQMPTLTEMLLAFMHKTAVNNNDPSATQYPNLVLGATSSNLWWSSNQQSASNAWSVSTSGAIYADTSKQFTRYVMPILEIPIN